MASGQLLQWLCLLLMVALACAHSYSWIGSSVPAGAELGDACTPHRAAICGDKILLNETETELTEEDGFSG